ncbi:MAG TPA: hypothetical protein VE912_13035 [Bacteroidales bacterium]|nr:hypothetical protein [Bacteroidales bacterium]
MELSATLIYWYISIGALIGWANNLIFKDKTLKMLPSIGFGVLGAVVLGPVSQLFGYGADNLVFSLFGAIGVLIIVNMFRSKDHKHAEVKVG